MIRTLLELGIERKNLFVSDNTKYSYHPGRSGSINLKSEKGPHLAYFGELHPGIVKNLDFKEKNIFGFEIFLKNILEPNKKLRQSKKSFQASDFQKSERDFAFIIDKNFKSQDLNFFVDAFFKNTLYVHIGCRNAYLYPNIIYIYILI